ncbi:uncharacterized protein DS421_12g383130 [Arachis hypogaea]|nr:uncharacterized protein DS421_12g383130 [Arachis hypogaea]
MAAQKEMGRNFSFKDNLIMCFKPYNNINNHNNNNNNNIKKERDDDPMVKDKLSDSMSKLKGTKYEYGSAKYPGYGFSSFITLTEFLDPNNGFLVNDSCSIEAEVCVVNDGHQHHPNDNRIVPLVTRNNDNNNLVDFKGLCKVKKDFVPLLEEACSKHPELVEGQKKRNQSEKFTENSFMTLGRVLHFLKSHKDVKDCTDDCVKEFQNLWKELESSGFDDLTWLENDVKNYTVKKLNENVDLQGEKGELLKVD